MIHILTGGSLILEEVSNTTEMSYITFKPLQFRAILFQSEAHGGIVVTLVKINGLFPGSAC